MNTKTTIILIILLGIAIFVGGRLYVKHGIEKSRKLFEEKTEAIATIVKHGNQRLEEIARGKSLEKKEAVFVIQDVWPLNLEDNYAMALIKIKFAINKLYDYGFEIRKLKEEEK